MRTEWEWKERRAVGDEWVKPERQRFTSDTCTSTQIPHQWLTLSQDCAIVWWRTLQTCPEYLPAALQVDPTQLYPRNRQNDGFQSAGLLAFLCLWEIKSRTLSWFTLPLFIPLKRKRGMRRSTCKGYWKGGLRVTEWLVRGRLLLVFSFSSSLSLYGPPLLWSLRNYFQWFYWGVWLWREVKGLFPSLCLDYI